MPRPVPCGDAMIGFWACGRQVQMSHRPVENLNRESSWLTRGKKKAHAAKRVRLAEEKTDLVRT